MTMLPSATHVSLRGPDRSQPTSDLTPSLRRPDTEEDTYPPDFSTALSLLDQPSTSGVSIAALRPRSLGVSSAVRPSACCGRDHGTRTSAAKARPCENLRVDIDIQRLQM